MSATRQKPDGLTNRERRFVAAYAGNKDEAARAAGYEMKPGQSGLGSKIYDQPQVRAALSNREIKILDKLISDRDERLLWLTKILRNKKEKTRDKLKAMEMLQKSCGDYIERHEITGGPPAAPPTVIVIKAGKESQTNISIGATKPEEVNKLVGISSGEELTGNERAGGELTK